MSTGPGVTQRKILKALQGTDIHGLEMGEVARSVFGDTCTESQRSKHRASCSEPGAARAGRHLLGRRREDSGRADVVRDPEQVRTAPAELRCPSEATGCPQIAQQGSPCGVFCVALSSRSSF
jgi:hypothetical protein